MNNRIDHPVKIAIVGVGNVGATFAYALLGSSLASQIVLIDANQKRAEGEAMDLNHAVPLTHSTKIWAGDYSDCANAAITVITAGTAQRPGVTRLDLVQRNFAIYQSIIPQIVKANPDGILLIASNPLDVLSYAAMKLSGFPANRVIGSGTILDTARFRYLLSQHAGVDPRSVHAYIIGEHGDSEVPVWSGANIAGMSLTEYCKMNCESFEPAVYDDIFTQTRDAAYQIIERKGATYYGIGMGLVRICEAILRGQNTVLSVSTLINDYYGIDNVYLSLPCVIGRQGVQKFMRLPLDDKEIAGLQQSAKILKETLHTLGL
jgi:L-lactate dehydrogenase